MLYTYDELDYNGQAEALYDQWSDLLVSEKTDEALSVMIASLEKHLSPVISYFWDAYSTRIKVNENVAWRLACDIRFPDEEECGGFAGLGIFSAYKFPVEVAIEEWMDDSSLEAFAAGVPDDDVAVFFELPDAEDIGLEYEPYIDNFNDEVSRMYSRLDSLANDMSEDYALVAWSKETLAYFVNIAITFYFDEHFDEVIWDVMTYVEPQLKALGPVFNKYGTRQDTSSLDPLAA